MRLRPLLIGACRVYTWAVVAACLAVAAVLSTLAVLRPLEIAESSALLLALAAALLLAALAMIVRRRLGAILVLGMAGAYGLWLAAVGAGGPAILAVLAAIVLLEAAALLWLRP